MTDEVHIPGEGAPSEEQGGGLAKPKPRKTPRPEEAARDEEGSRHGVEVAAAEPKPATAPALAKVVQRPREQPAGKVLSTAERMRFRRRH
jgi:hypothetical protein